MAKKEQHYQKQIYNYIQEELNGYSVITIECSKSGVHDVLAAIPMTKEQVDKYFETHDKLAIFVSFEVKDPINPAEYTPLQEENEEQVTLAGGIASKVHTVDEVKQFLTAHKVLPDEEEI